MCPAKQDEMGRQDLRSEPKQLMTSSFDDGDDYDMHKSFREKSKGQKLFYLYFDDPLFELRFYVF